MARFTRRIEHFRGREMEKQIRIKWEINQKTGHGSWHDISAKETLIQWVNEMNARYGEGTHWIEVSNE